MQAIRTRYIGPTNARDARIQAKCEAKTIYVTWDDALNIDENHRIAAIKLASQLEWHNEFVGGVFDSDYYWTIANTPVTLSFNSDKSQPVCKHCGMINNGICTRHMQETK